MALQYAAAFESTGVEAPEAYAKITSFSYVAEWGELIRFSVDVFFNTAARAAGKIPINSFAFEVAPYDFSEQAAVKQKLYEFLKTQSEFASAIDV